MNGRVNIEQPNTDTLFSLKDKIAVKSSDYRDALTGTITKTNLSNAYFSKNNMGLFKQTPHLVLTCVPFVHWRFFAKLRD